MEQVKIRVLEPSTTRQQTSNGSALFGFVMSCIHYGIKFGVISGRFNPLHSIYSWVMHKAGKSTR